MLQPFRLCLFVLRFSFGLAASATVFAYAALVAAVPAAGSHVAAAPKIERTFNEALVPRASRMTLGKADANGSPARIDQVEIEPANGSRTVRTTPRHALGPGKYEPSGASWAPTTTRDAQRFRNAACFRLRGLKSCPTRSNRHDARSIHGGAPGS